MRTLIVEDEPLAAERLTVLLQQLRPAAVVVAVTESIAETTQWLKENSAPDLILMDIQLSDGPSFEIFRTMKSQCPVILTTAFDSYAMDAFKLLSIDYLLKPVTKASLKQALDKLELLSGKNNTAPRTYKARFLARIGSRSFFIDTGEIAYFSADNKIVYLYAHDGTRYIIDYTLENLEQMLDPRQFFRLNRSIIVQASAIQHIKPHINSRLKLNVKAGSSLDELIVSRERVPAFREWAES